MRLCVLIAWLFLASPLQAASGDNTTRAVGGSSSLSFQAAIEAGEVSNEDSEFCYTTTGISYFSNWSTSLALPPPFDFPPSLVAYGLNLLLKFCPPLVTIPPATAIDPAGACSVELGVETAAAPRIDHVFWVPTRGSTAWGGLGKVGAQHMNSEVELTLFDHTGLDSEAGISFPIGRHQVTWRGNTMVSALDKAFIYVPGIPSGTRWKKAIDTFVDVGVEAGLIAADVVLEGERHGIWNDETQLLNVLDLVPPSVSVSQPSITLEANAFGGATLYFYRDVIEDLVLASDNCGRPVSISYSQNYFPVDQVTNLFITATDLGPNELGQSNSDTTQLQVMVEDTVPPVLRLPENRVLETAGASAVVVLGQADVFDFVDDAPTVEHDALSQPGVMDLGGGEFEFPLGLTEVTWTALDASGNMDSGIQTINVKALGTNMAPVAFGDTVATQTEVITEILLEANDSDADPLNFRITDEPDHGSLISPLLPVFIEDYRQEVGAAPPGEVYRCQPGRPANELAWPHAVSVTEDGFSYILDVGSDLPIPNAQFTTCESFVFNRWPEYRIHKLAPDGAHLASIDLPELGGHYFGGTLSIDEQAGTLLYAAALYPENNAIYVISLDTLEILEIIPFTIHYNEAWKGILTSDDILVHMAGTDELYFHDLRQQRIVSPENEAARIQPFPPGEFHTDIVFDSEGNLYVKSEGPLLKYAPYSFDEDGNFVPGELIGWMGACNAGPGCDVANGRSRGFSCTFATCTWESTFGDVDKNIPGRSLGVSLAVDPLDNLYVGGANIQRFTPTGLFSGIAYPDCPTEQRCFVLGDFGGAFSLFVNEHHLYTVDPDFELFHVFQTSVITPLDDDTASVKYLSEWAFNAQDSFSFSAGDGLTESAPAQVTINVARQFRAPVAYADRRQTLAEDTPTALMLDGYDPDGPLDTLSFDVLGQPLHGSVAQQGADWVYTPDADYSGPDQVQFRVFDGLDYTAPELFFIDVQPVNDAPVVTLNEPPDAGRGYDVGLTAGFTDADPFDRHRVSVDWGDGTVELEGDGPMLSEANGQKGQAVMSHAYATSGTFSVEVCITDNIVLVDDVKQVSITSLQTCAMDSIDVSAKADTAPGNSLADTLAEFVTYTYTISVANNAPESGAAIGTTGITLDHTIENATIVGFTPGITGIAGTCSDSATEVNCTVAALAPDTAFAAEITIMPDPGIGIGDSMEFVTAVSANEPDPYPENTLFDTVTLVPGADFVVSERRDLPDASFDGTCATAETGKCSLRAAVDEANNSDASENVIQLGLGNYALSKDEGTGLYFDNPVTIRGLGPGKTALYMPKGSMDVSYTTLTLEDLTLEGSADGPLYALYGGLNLDNVVLRQNQSSLSVVTLLLSSVDIRNSALVQNTGTAGAPILLNDSSVVDLTNVSILDNSTDGPVLEQTTGDFEPASGSLTHVTAAGNTAATLLYVDAGPLQVANSVLSDNAVESLAGCAGDGQVVGNGGNVLATQAGCFDETGASVMTDQPMLEPLQNFGDGQFGRMPLTGSPAIDFAQPGPCPPNDQLGRSRPYDGDTSGTAECDAGALEFLPDWIFDNGFEM